VSPADDGLAVHYTALQRGTPVWSSDGEQIGKVAEVLDNYREHIFDGLVIETPSGERRFVDAPEVERTAERAELGPPPSGRGGLRGLFRRRR
jgi:hypothetical protein